MTKSETLKRWESFPIIHAYIDETYVVDSSGANFWLRSAHVFSHHPGERDQVGARFQRVTYEDVAIAVMDRMTELAPFTIGVFTTCMVRLSFSTKQVHSADHCPLPKPVFARHEATLMFVALASPFTLIKVTELIALEALVNVRKVFAGGYCGRTVNE